jgi:glutamine amidotransferase
VIAVVDYGLGNLGSVLKAFRHCGADVLLSAEPDVLQRADALVLPGDGAFGATMDEIRARGLVELLTTAAARGVPLLGICVGMQVLFESSEEHGQHVGLGLLAGHVRRFFGALPDPGLAIPHMGWNRLHRQREHALLAGLDEGAHVYFVHSYYCDARPAQVLATTDYGLSFPAIVAAGNVLGMQFHPEKSQTVGLRLIANFVASVQAGGRRTRPDQAARGVA